MSDLVGEFVSVTGASVEVANQLLEASGFSLQTAVELFFADPGAFSGGAGAGAAGAGGGGGAGMGQFSDDVGMMGGDSFGGGGIAGGDAMDAMLDANGELQVRAPDTVKRQRLVDEGAGHAQGYVDGEDEGASAMGGGVNPFRDFGREARTMKAAAAGPGGSGGPVLIGVSGGAAGGGAGAASASGAGSDGGGADSQQQQLSDLFAPPRELMFTGPFQAARSQAKDERKWLMVNVQRDDEFDCHRMNRDVWKDDLVANVVSR
jgi:hypothetical protein